MNRLSSGQPIAPPESKEQKNAITESRRDIDPGWGGAPPDQPVYSHGLQHQNDPECRGGRGSLRMVAASDRTMEQRNRFQALEMIPSEALYPVMEALYPVMEAPHSALTET